MLKILQEARLMYLEFKDFQVLQEKSYAVFDKWDELLKNFRDTIRSTYTTKKQGLNP